MPDDKKSVLPELQVTWLRQQVVYLPTTDKVELVMALRLSNGDTIQREIKRSTEGAPYRYPVREMASALRDMALALEAADREHRRMFHQKRMVLIGGPG